MLLSFSLLMSHNRSQRRRYISKQSDETTRQIDKAAYWWYHAYMLTHTKLDPSPRPLFSFSVELKTPAALLERFESNKILR